MSVYKYFKRHSTNYALSVTVECYFVMTCSFINTVLPWFQQAIVKGLDQEQRMLQGQYGFVSIVAQPLCTLLNNKMRLHYIFALIVPL